ncbi:hypothetical protein ABZZ16_26935, partial [Streptomyces sp. NPDC006386]|uniref:hypothetical protein n=1 Tax=Streptomyces sp. NPDC006386 TaxID=3156762 RepID=UPI0033ACA89A
MSVVSIERLESLPEQYLVELTKGIRAVSTLVEGVSRAHQIVDEPAEGLGRLIRAAVRLSQHRFQHVGNPAMPGRPVVLPVSAESREKLMTDPTPCATPSQPHARLAHH